MVAEIDEPVVRGGRRRSDASKLTSTLARYYAARRKLWAQDYPDFYDADLRRIFSEAPAGHGTAAAFMRRRGGGAGASGPCAAYIAEDGRDNPGLPLWQSAF